MKLSQWWKGVKERLDEADLHEYLLNDFPPLLRVLCAMWYEWMCWRDVGRLRLAAKPPYWVYMTWEEVEDAMSFSGDDEILTMLNSGLLTMTQEKWERDRRFWLGKEAPK